MTAIHQLFISAGHEFFGHHGQPAGSHPIQELEEVECVAGRGLRGDRFFDYRENYKGQITFFSLDVFDELQEALQLSQARPQATRRNVFVREVELNQLVGMCFEIQGLRFEGVEECRPCHWMDTALGPGAAAWLRGRGGLRARILTGGFLRRSL